MGSFVENSLLSGEKVMVNASISWLSQFWLLLFAALFVILGLAATGGFFIIAIILAIVAVINVTTTELAMTNKKVIGKYGFIRRKSIDLPLNRLESLRVDQGLVGRILGYGRVTIRGTGGTPESIPNISGPLDFRRAAMQIVDDTQKPA